METSDFLQNVKANHQHEVQRAVEADPSLANARDGNGISAVLLAIYHGHRELAQWLAEHGANLNFFEACALGNAALVKRMLNEEPGLASVYSPDGFQGLGLACFFGHPGVVDALLAAGADVNSASRNQMKVGPIHSAAANRDPQTALKMVRMLLDGGADPNVAQHGGWTPLQEAAAHGNTDLVRLLLERGADRNAVAANGKTALDLATGANHTEAAAALSRS